MKYSCRSLKEQWAAGTVLSVSTRSVSPERRYTRHRDYRHKVVNSPQCQIWGSYLWVVPGPKYISVSDKWSPGGNFWSEVGRKPLVYSYAGNQDILPKTEF